MLLAKNLHQNGDGRPKFSHCHNRLTVSNCWNGQWLQNGRKPEKSLENTKSLLRNPLPVAPKSQAAPPVLGWKAAELSPSGCISAHVLSGSKKNRRIRTFRPMEPSDVASLGDLTGNIRLSTRLGDWCSLLAMPAMPSLRSPCRFSSASSAPSSLAWLWPPVMRVPKQLEK